MRVLHLILTLERAGAQAVLRTLAACTPPERAQLVVATLEDGEVREDLEGLGVRVVVLGPRRFGIERPLAFLREQRALLRTLRQLVEAERIAVVQTHLLQTLDFLTLGLREPGRAVLWTLHNEDFLPAGRGPWERLKRRVHAWLYRALAGRVDGFVAVSEGVARALAREIGAGRGRVRVIPNGIEVPTARGRDRARPRGLPSSGRLLLTVGRLVEQKGQADLLEAFARLEPGGQDLHLVLAGEGPLQADLRAQAARLGLSDRVHLLGLRSDIQDLLEACELFALPSRWEGLSIVLLEALAAGLPVVATRVSGTEEVMRDGVHGRVVPPREPLALAAALRELLDAPERARQLGAAGRMRVLERFSGRAMAQAHLDLYEEVCRP